MIQSTDAIYFPMVVTAAGIAVSFLTIWCTALFTEVSSKLFWQIVISTVLMTGAIVPCLWMLPDSVTLVFGGVTYVATVW
jgi:hypothetical protein